MNYDHIIELQKKFYIFHKIIFFFLSAFLILQNKNIRSFDFVPFFIVIPFLFAEYILLHRGSVKIGLLMVFRYVQIILITIYLTSSLVKLNANLYGFLLTCLLLLMTEYFFLFDFLDNYYRTICFITMGVALIMLPILCFLTQAFDMNRLADVYLVLGFVILFLIFFTNIFVVYFNYNNERLFSQSRLIESVSETNEALRVNQEKVKKANEQLGIQKIKLEAANNKINSVNSEMMIQNQIVKYISSSLKIGKLMTLITDSILEEMGVDVCAIMLQPGAANNDKIKYKIRSKMNDVDLEHLSTSIENNCFHEYLYTNSTYIDNRVSPAKYSFINNNLVGSLIVVPLIKKEIQIGALYVAHPNYDFFAENTSFYEAIVAQFLIALDNANLYAKMESMAMRDGLTGVYNRRHLTKLFGEVIKDAVVNKRLLSVALLDIDKFKNVNDTYGHTFGDTVIRSVARLAYAVAKKYNGIVGRYGGEEFVILFPEKGLKEAYRPVALLQKRVKETPLVHNNETIYVKVSVGITSYPETCMNPSELLNRADWAMYYSKQHGRDQIDRKSVV